MTQPTSPHFKDVEAILDRIVRAIEESMDLIIIDPNDLGSTLENYRTLDRRLAPWRQDAVGTALRAGLTELGRMIAPEFTMADLKLLAADVSDKSANKHYAFSWISSSWSGLQTKDGLTWLN